MYCTGASVSGVVAGVVVGVTVAGDVAGVVAGVVVGVTVARADRFGAGGLTGRNRVPDTGATRVRVGIDLARAGCASAMRVVRPPETATDTATTARVNEDTLRTARSRSRLALVVLILMKPGSASPR